MRTNQVTEINVYHTPDKGSKPDLKNQSHLKTTIPSVYQGSQQRHYSQYGIHHSKMRQYQDLNRSAQQAYTDKRASKNQWELKEKVDEYQSQIGLLRQYLRGCHCDCLEKKSIGRIFGFQDRETLATQQQRVVKQLGSKVRNLIRENSSLKTQNAHYSQLNIEQIIQQNQKLQNLLQDYKISDSVNHRRLIQQNQLLKDDLYRLRMQYEEKIKLIEIQHQTTLSRLKTNENELLRKVEMLERQNEANLRKSTIENQKLSSSKLREIQEIHAKQLKQTESIWRQKLNEQQQYYDRIRVEWENASNQTRLLIHNEEIKRLKQYYIDVIQDLETEQKLKFQRLLRNVDGLEKRIDKTNQSIEHFKFQRENRLQQTIRKSINVAASSAKPKGQSSTDQFQLIEEQVKINTRPLSNTVSPRMSSHHVDILNHKIAYLQKQIAELKMKLSLSERLVGEKTEKILNLQNQIRNLNLTIHNLNIALNQSKGQVIVREIVKQVPVGVVPKDYTEEVKNIKESIISCNLSNFDVFQTEFNEIIEQRNQMNSKLQSLKKEAKESSKVLVLEKHLKVERERSKQLQDNLKRYEQQIQALKIQVIELQNQIETIHAKEILHDAEQVNKMNIENMPDGKAGLEWQKVVKHCLMTSINRLQTLQNKMKEDLQASK